MSIILVSIDNQNICFSKYNGQAKEENLNNTNVIDVRSLKFTENYILENLELVSTFINLIILKFNINNFLIKNLEVAETALKLLENLNTIKYINFSEEKELTYTICAQLLQNKNIENIECYSLPIIMFYRFNERQIKTRCEILSKSNFIKINNINTFSDVFNKSKIIIDEYLTEEDVNDLICFFNTNMILKKIEFKNYNRKNLKATLELLKQNGLKGIKIFICQQENTTDALISDIDLFKKMNKKYCVNIKIKYSKQYKEKNKIKELNIIMLRNTAFVCLIVGIISLFAYKMLEYKHNKNIDKNIDEINNKIESTIISDNNNESETTQNNSQTSENQHTSSYYKNYSKVYNELIKLNSDTVGWLSVNNTKINYPVVQTSNNDFYLNHAYDKSTNMAGWLFVDYRNNLNVVNKNTIIYGHSMLKGNIMFSTLEKALNPSWYNNEKNLTIHFSIKGKDIKWKIFSIYTIEQTSDYLSVNFTTEKSFLEFINKLKSRSINNFNTEIDSSDKILTLSTCYKDNNHRIVVHAVML